VAGRKQDDSDIRPAKAGWYPDPWSADGRGERYFDGKKWGTSERPLPRDATVTKITSKRATRTRLRQFGPVLIFAGAVLAVWGIPKLLHSHHGRAAITQLPTVTTPLSAHPPSGVGEASAPLGYPAPVPAGNGKFAVLHHQVDRPNVPIAFDPCRPVHYVMNPAGAPADGAALIRSAVGRLRTATGLDFIYDGTTRETPSNDRQAYQPTRYPDRWAPVLIAWSNEDAFPGLAGYIAGLGMPLAATANGSDWAYVSGQVVLDERQLAPKALPDRPEARAIILHELGHLVGLDHTSDRREIMYSESQFNVTDYGNGDLRGLSLLGTQACFPDL
jgi:hypothetical protein